jgi:hypothetical protein
MVMSLFQCENCGCCENTALSYQGFKGMHDLFDWSNAEHLNGKLLCSACGPSNFKSGAPTGYGQWHKKFDRVFLPMGEFKTNHVGNLEHIKSGSEDYRSFALPTSEAKE